MAKRMLVDATHPEETRVVVVNGNRVEEFDFETSTKKQLKGNIYLARVTRVEPSLQAAFVEYGGNRHGFLAFSEIHPDYYRIPVADRQALMAAEAVEDEDDEATERRGGGTPPAAEPRGPSLADALESRAAETQSPEPASLPAAAENVAVVSAPPEAWSSFEAPVDATPPTETRPDDQPHQPHVTPPSADEAGAAASPSPPPAEGTVSQPSMFDMPLSEAAPGTGETAGAVETVRTEPVVVESVGGDEMEEVEQRRRHRPMRHYKIQEVIKRRQILLVQVVKEERGTKGAALTTYL